MSVLRIHLLGGFDLSQGDRLLPGFSTQKARDLFALLVLNRERRFPRDVLVGIFWGEKPESAARRNLRTDLWRIRQVLGTAGTPAMECLLTRGDQVGFNPDAAFWLDVSEFENLIRMADMGADELSTESVRRLQKAVALYRGHLLEEVYDDWCVYERERLRQLYVTALERLMEHHQARGEWDAAIATGQRLLRADTILEHVHRNLIRCYHLQGNRSGALRQFATCRDILQEELGVEPMEETLALYEQVRDASPIPERLPDSVVRNAERLLADVDAAIDELQSVSRKLERSRHELKLALEPSNHPAVHHRAGC